MKTNHYTRRRLIASLATGSFMFATSGPFTSFGRAIKQLDILQGSDLLSYVDSNGKTKPVTTREEWQIKRQQILEGMQGAMGRLPATAALPAFDIETVEQFKENNYTRSTINFTVADKERIPALLYVPATKNNKEKLPAILALHETNAIGKLSLDGKGINPNLAYAKELAEKGYVVIAPDYPSFGGLKEYDFKTDRYQSGTMKSIFNNIRCVDLLLSREDVDPQRIGVIGHSLGGHNAMFTAAFDTRLKVVVSSCGWTLFDYYNAGENVSKQYGGRLGPWAQERYMPLIRDKYELNDKKIPFDFDEIIASLAPRAFFSSSPVNDSNFSVAGVRKAMGDVSRLYRFFSVENNLQVRYPDCEHDFPPEVRKEAYAFIDKILG